MRKVSRSWKAAPVALLRRWALERSVPKGFSTMRRAHDPRLVRLSPLARRFSRMTSNSVGEEAR